MADPRRPLAPRLGHEPADAPPRLPLLRHLRRAADGLGRARLGLEQDELGRLGALPDLVRARAAVVPRRRAPQPLRPRQRRADPALARCRRPAPRRGRGRAARPVARDRLPPRRPRRLGRRRRPGRRGADGDARAGRDDDRARRPAGGRARPRSVARRGAGHDRPRRVGGRAPARERAPPGRAALPVQLPRHARQHRSEPLHPPRPGGDDREPERRRGRGGGRGRRGGDPRPQVLGRLHRRVGARGRDRALRGGRARPPCRRVREHLRQPPRREPRRVLALRPASGRARPDQGDHRGRHRHHGAPRGGSGPRARARVPEHDRERGAEPPPADRRARGDRAPRLQQGVRARARGGAARDARHRALGRLRRSGGVGDGAAADQACRGRRVRRRPRQHVGDEERSAPVGARGRASSCRRSTSGASSSSAAAT